MKKMKGFLIRRNLPPQVDGLDARWFEELQHLPPEQQRQALEHAARTTRRRVTIAVLVSLLPGLVLAHVAAALLIWFLYGTRIGGDWLLIVYTGLAAFVLGGVAWAWTRFVLRPIVQRQVWEGARQLCPGCGYDLTGNTSGVCPECGRIPCPTCGYDLTGNTGLVCPECGRETR